MADDLYTYGGISRPQGVLVLSTLPYSLADGTFESLAVKLNRVEASSPFFDGSWSVQTTRQNDEFPLNVRCRSSSLGPAFAAAKAVTDALLQDSFTLTLGFGDHLMAFTCFAAEYVLETNRPLLHASQVLVKSTVTAIPS